MMELEQIKREIEKVNNYLRKCSWMDFTLAQANPGKIELYGAVDQSYNNYIDNYEIRIDFEQPYYLSSIFNWNTDTTKPVLELINDDSELNLRYKIEKGHYIFRIYSDEFDNSPIYIVAKGISCKILNENPFPQNK